jgi:hypothetical protein
MRELGRNVWLQVRHGVETLSGAGRAVWSEPAQVRKALGEMLGVLPATHIEIELEGFLEASEPRQWTALLRREGAWAALLDEQALAIGSAVRAPAVWGLGLPAVQTVATAAGDVSERGQIKAGMLLASALQAFRSAPVAFVTIPVSPGDPTGERARGPVLRNGELYGWARAVRVSELAATSPPVAGVEATLVEQATVAELSPRWARGELVGGGLGASVWSGQPLVGAAPARFLLFGQIPAGTAARALVETGRMLRDWVKPGAA